MTSKSLWGDLSELETETVRTPVAILREQAQHLANATNGMLIGEVRAIDFPTHDFNYDFDICVPSLNNYTYTVLHVRHNVDLYPLEIDADKFKKKCENESEFESALGEVLGSKRTRVVISRLLSQVRS